MNNALVRLIGWKATILHGDPCVHDRWKWLKRHLAPGPLRTLDAGCGSGAFTLYAASIGNASVGIDINPAHIQAARVRAAMLRLSHAEFLEADLKKLDQLAGLGVSDQIICCETIEHLRNDRKLLTDLSRLLRPGGRLLLTTPFKHYRHLFGDRVSEREDGGHVRLGYTHDEMRRLLGACGLDVVIEEFISGVVSQNLTNLTRVFSRLHPRVAWAAVFPLRSFQALDAPVTRVLRYPYLSIGIVARK